MKVFAQRLGFQRVSSIIITRFFLQIYTHKNKYRKWDKQILKYELSHYID